MAVDEFVVDLGIGEALGRYLAPWFDLRCFAGVGRICSSATGPVSLRLQAATMHNVINWTATIAPRPGVR